MTERPAIDPQGWQRVRALFDQAVELPEAERADWLRAHAPDATLRAEVEALLAADARDAARTQLSRQAPELLARLAGEQAQADAAPRLQRQFGAWRLVAPLGEGGMGAVYLAERVEGGFTQRAALKLVRAGWGSEELRRRFLAERQILAGLAHPHIARLLDGGAGPDGEPFLALEYVEGSDLRQHCDTRRLDLRARLALFLTVCDAVAHAHARLVVHRDLKPGNILVSAAGEVKLLDFGVAKLLEDDGLAPEATAARWRLFTPEYAAPEQVRGEPTTTAVDVYALGVLLFELLTGRSPYPDTARSAAGLEHAVLHAEAPRPSSVVTRAPEGAPAAQDPAALAASRRQTPAQLRALLRGDLDQIVLKALRKRPEDRYASVRALADDVRAWLERRPVAARRGSRRYRSWRFVQRHALAVALAAVALLGLLGGLGAALWQAREAALQRDAAQREAGKAQAALGFMTGLFQLADPEAHAGAPVSARELLARGAERIRAELHDQPQARAELLRAMGEAHLGLGLYQDALPLLEEARGEAGQSAPAALSHAIALHALGRHDEARAALQALARDPAVAADAALAARVQLRRAVVAQALNRLDEADADYRAALAAHARLFGPQAGETHDAMVRYASLRVLRRDFGGARDMMAPVVATLRAQRPRDEVRLARALGALAMAVSNTGPYAEAEALRREQVQLATRIYGAEHPTTLGARNDLAAVLFAQERYAEAEPEFAAVLAARRAQFGPDHPVVATVGTNLATALLQLGRPEEARPLAEEALRVRLATFGERHHNIGVTRRVLASVEAEAGHWQAARDQLERGLAAFEATLGPDSRTLLGTLNDLVRARLMLDDPDPDCALARRALQLSGMQAVPPQRPDAQYQYALLGACRAASGDPAGLEAVRRAIPILRDAYGVDDRRARYFIEFARTR